MNSIWVTKIKLNMLDCRHQNNLMTTRAITDYWKSLPRWFRIFFCAAAIAYGVIWIGTVSISHSRPDIAVPVLSQDSTEYAQLSQTIINNLSFVTPQGTPETFRTPGYPAFEAITRLFGNGSFFAVTLAQFILALGAGLMIQRIGRKLFSKQVGAISAAVFLANPLTVILA